MSIGAHLKGWLWDHSLLWRRPARRLRDDAARWRDRLARARGHDVAPRVRTVAADASSKVPALPHPAIRVLPGPDLDPDALQRFLDRQTETSVEVMASENSVDGPDRDLRLIFVASGDLDGLPATHLEALLLAAAAEDLPMIRGGWSSPDDDTIRLAGDRETASSLLLRPARRDEPVRAAFVARDVVHPTDDHGNAPPLPEVGTRSGPYTLGTGAPATSVVQAIDRRLATLPAVDDRPTVLFLQPYLAVGGAERQLLDVLDEWGDLARVLLVTVEPHGGTRGHLLDAFRQRTPHVYLLGDWLPRDAHDGAIRHLLRRYRVHCLASWNGTVIFYDQVAAWRRDVPDLRIANQVYNHEGGWIDHYGPRIRRHVDVHLAVNRRIETAMVERHGVDAERVAVVHPSARVVAPRDAETRARLAHERRAELGLPADAFVVGTFIRLHEQKRPLDILAVARRFIGTDVYFLLVGGGPLSRTVERALADEPIPNLVRFGLRNDVEQLYDALDLCFMTSAFEGLPVFLLDGLVREIPCVTTAVGDIPLLLADGGGIAVDEPGDLDALVAGIETLRDPARRAAEGARGRQIVADRFDMKSFAARYRSLLLPEVP